LHAPSRSTARFFRTSRSASRPTTDGHRVTSRWEPHGTHKGRTVTLPGITLSRFENGKIAEDWTLSDNLDLLRRLGVRRGLALAARHLAGRLPGSRS
jgi:hypothetical protein